MSRKSWWKRDEAAVPGVIDQTLPSPARLYDYFLGGKDNYAADREAGEKVRQAIPNTYDIVWENRLFLQRAVRFLAGQGIRQFLDIGTGLPTQGNVHEVAQQEAPDSRVVYVDNDPIVLAHGRALLSGTAATTVIQADMRRPQEILDHEQLHRLIDFDKPVAVLLVAVLHFVTDDHDPAALVRTLREAMAPGSYLALSHLTTDGPDPEAVDQTVKVYEQATAPIVFRPRDQIGAFFDGLHLVEPGIVRPWQWHTDEHSEHRTDWLYAGVARKTT